MIEDKTKIVFDEIEQSLITNAVGEVEKKAVKERILEAKIFRADKLAKALSKS